jgi:hypothetical protein
MPRVPQLISASSGDFLAQHGARFYFDGPSRDFPRESSPQSLGNRERRRILYRFLCFRSEFFERPSLRAFSPSAMSRLARDRAFSPTRWVGYGVILEACHRLALPDRSGMARSRG